MNDKAPRIFSIDGSDLALDICKYVIEKGDYQQILTTNEEILDYNSIIGNLVIDEFSDGEFSPQFKDTVRDRKVFLVGSTNTPSLILKMLLSIDAAKRSSAEEIAAVIPYLGYSRQDRREGTRGPIGAKLMADLLEKAGADRVIFVDLHAEQIQGFFDVPVDHISGHTVFYPALDKIVFENSIAVASPDAGGVKRAMKFYKKALTRFPEASFAMLEKRREKPNEIAHMNLIGDVSGRDVIIIDDMVDTAGTLSKAAEVLKSAGAKTVRAFITHGVLSGKALEVISRSKLDRLYITDSIIQRDQVKSHEKITIVPCARILGRAILTIVKGGSLDKVNS